MIDGIGRAAPLLAKGNDSSFMNKVHLHMHPEDEQKKKKAADAKNKPVPDQE
jgi:hypothetical protein